MTPETRDRIIRRWQNGATEREIAEQYGGRRPTEKEICDLLRMEGLHPAKRDRCKRLN